MVFNRVSVSGQGAVNLSDLSRIAEFLPYVNNSNIKLEIQVMVPLTVIMADRGPQRKFLCCKSAISHERL